MVHLMFSTYCLQNESGVSECNMQKNLCWKMPTSLITYTAGEQHNGTFLDVGFKSDCTKGYLPLEIVKGYIRGDIKINSSI